MYGHVLTPHINFCSLDFSVAECVTFHVLIMYIAARILYFRTLYSAYKFFHTEGAHIECDPAGEADKLGQTSELTLRMGQSNDC